MSKQLKAATIRALSGATIALLLCLVLAPAALAQGVADFPGSGLALIDQWSLIGGVLLPFVIGVAIQRGWSSQVQSAVSVGICVLWALLGVVINQGFDSLILGIHVGTPDGIIQGVFAAVLMTYGLYKTLYQALPGPQKLEELTGGDPLVTVVPNRNVA